MRDHLLDALRREIEEPAAARDAGVVDEQVQGRMALADPRGDVLDLRAVGDVASLGLGAELGRDRSSRSAPRARRTQRQPRSVRSGAVAAPIPLDPPVTTATRIGGGC